MNKNLLPHPRASRLACLFTLAFSLLAHGYRYLSMSFSGDAMLLSQAGEEAYQISLGRFLQPVYWQIRGTITAPLTIGLFAAAFLMVSACLIADLLAIRRPAHIALLCGILAASETMYISNATYLPWTDVYMLAMALCVLGVYAFFRLRFGFLLCPVFFCLSLGLYQSYLPVASTLIILVLFARTLRGESPARLFRTGVTACVSLLLGLLLYALVLNVLLRLFGITASQDYNGVGRVGLPPLHEIPKLLLDTCTAPIRFLFIPSDTPVMTWHIPLTPKWLNLAILAVSALLLAQRMRRLPLRSVLLALFLMAMLAPSMNFIQFISRGIASGLTIYAYVFFYLIPLALMALPEGGDAPRFPRLRILPRCAAGLLCLLILMNIMHGSQAYVKRDLEWHATTSAMTRVLSRAEKAEGYVPGETPVVLMGMLPSSPVSMEKPGFESLARVQGMRYTYAASYETSTYWYLQMAIGQPVHLVSHEERAALSAGAEAQSLSLFPDPGCCRMIDGRLYIRFN